jgi:hypothetical protein
MAPKLPVFRTLTEQSKAPESPEQLFYKLGGRAKSHGYLRGPQQDVLREFNDKYKNVTDLALELPTGTGKTTVGLLIAEWARLSGKKVAFLCLTNQLASQVAEEGMRLGITCADLRGTKETRSVSEEAKYRTKSAVAVTTYSNLFNVNPIIRDADLLIFDDAHGGEQFVSSMWTVSIKRYSDTQLFTDVLNALSPAMSRTQIAAVFDDTAPVGVVDLADVQHHPECIERLEAVLGTTDHNSRYAWSQIKQHLDACFFLISAHEISIRPFIPPTHTHDPFRQAKQRLYMSATLGGGSDLLRAYGILKIDILKSQSAQWGRRYIFVPSLYCTEDDSYSVFGEIWGKMNPQRAVLLSPSDRILTDSFDKITAATAKQPDRLLSSAILDNLTPFTTSTNVILTLAGRYDGLDLPDDQCRLLVLSGSPVAINLLERHLSERWKLTALFRRRERTRLIQGMGRCTRNATDFALIFLMGQALADSATSSTFIEEFPPELAAELTWGLEQSQSISSAPKDFVDMALGLVSDSDYRKQANEAISSTVVAGKTPVSTVYEDSAIDEVRFSQAMWEGAYENALGTARSVADLAGGPQLAGYRGWWWYLASIAAHQLSEKHVEIDALGRAAAAGINASWLLRLLREQRAAIPAKAEIQSEADELWTAISDWGWTGPDFGKKMQEMQLLLSSKAHKDVHRGVEILGRCFGSRSIRPKEEGAPDVAWLSGNRAIAFEAKTEKKEQGALYKKELQEAKGHPDWLQYFQAAESNCELTVDIVIISPTQALHNVAVPFARGLFVVSPQTVADLAKQAAKAISELRTKFTGKEFTEVALEFSESMRVRNLTWEAAEKVLLADKLAKSVKTH